MSKELNLKSLNVLPQLKKYYLKYRRHLVFVVVLAILLVYVLVVFKINRLANAEPSPDQEVLVTSSVPRIDANAIKQIQSLENNSPNVHSLFEQARNNPFQE